MVVTDSQREELEFLTKHSSDSQIVRWALDILWLKQEANPVEVAQRLKITQQTFYIRAHRWRPRREILRDLKDISPLELALLTAAPGNSKIIELFGFLGYMLGRNFEFFDKLPRRTGLTEAVLDSYHACDNRPAE